MAAHVVLMLHTHPMWKLHTQYAACDQFILDIDAYLRHISPHALWTGMHHSIHVAENGEEMRQTALGPHLGER